MAPLPKRKHSVKRKGTRMHAKKVRSFSQLIVCKNCGKPKLPHKVCKHCGK